MLNITSKTIEDIFAKERFIFESVLFLFAIKSFLTWQVLLDLICFIINLMEFGKILKELRIEKALSQNELSKLVAISQSAIAKWELEKTEPTASALKKLATFFEVSVDYLLGISA